jgi:hypothetical protein
LASALLAAAVISAAPIPSSRAQTAATPGPRQGTAKEPNSRITTDEKGRRVVELRWAPGRTGPVVKLRVPVNYVWPGGGGIAAALGPNYPDPNVVGPYMDTFVLEALLPDFEPRTQENAERFKAGISGETVKISVSVAPPVARSGGALIDRFFRDKLPMVHPPAIERLFRTKFVHKADRFGLKRMGPIGDFEQFRTFGAIDDIYFPDYDPKDVFMVCSAEEIRDVTEDPTWNRRPICQHTYYSKSLGASVTLTYRRIHLRNWRTIQADAEKLLKSFEMIGASGGNDGSSRQQ